MALQQTVTATHDIHPSLICEPRATLELRHSLHEEFITAMIHLGARAFDLGARAHHGLLLELSRARLRDRAASVCAGEEGWVHLHDLSQRLGLEPTHLNVQIYRIRRQLRELAFPHPRRLVERRSGCGELRVGVSVIHICRL